MAVIRSPCEPGGLPVEPPRTAWPIQPPPGGNRGDSDAGRMFEAWRPERCSREAGSV